MKSSVYDKWYPDMYAWMVADAQRSMSVANFVLRMHARQAIGKPSVLDAGCGTGQIAAALARAGARVTAVDSSNALIKIASGITAGLDVTLIESDFASSRLQRFGPFDLVACLFNTFGHPSDHGPAQILQSWARWLAPCGVVYVEFPRLESSSPGFTESKTRLPSGVVVKESRTIDHHEQKCVIALEFSDGREDVVIDMNLFSFEDVRSLAKRASLDPRFWEDDEVPFAGVRGSHCVSLIKAVHK